MTHEERVAWIKRGFFGVLALGMICGVAVYPGRKKNTPDDRFETTTPKVAPHEAADAAENPEAAADSGPPVEIILLYLPGDADSALLDQRLTRLEEKYGGQVVLTRVDVTANPERAKAEKVTDPPKVVMMAGDVRACKFQGLWTQAQLERKVDQILRGLKRFGRDWRPPVPGMEPAGGS